MLKLQKDDRADILGLPLELFIILVVVMISLPVIYSYFSMYAQRQTESDLNRELDDLIKTIREVDKAEHGNRRSFSLKFEGHPLARLSYIELGGKDEHLRSTLRYRFSGREEVQKSLGGIEVSYHDGEGFLSFEIPLDGESIIIERSPSYEFIRITVGDGHT